MKGLVLCYTVYFTRNYENKLNYRQYKRNMTN